MHTNNTAPSNYGSGEAISIYFRLNDTTDYLIATVATINQIRHFVNTTLNVPVNAGDFFEIKIVFPIFATLPSGTNFSGYLNFES